MKIIAISTLAATLVVILASGAAYADAQVDSVSGVKPRNVCLWAYMIDHTTYKRKDNSILFHMRNGKVWKNHLRTPCYGLSFHGFFYVSRTEDICANFQSIRVLHSGEVCMLGPFTPYVKPKLEKAALN